MQAAQAADLGELGGGGDIIPEAGVVRQGGVVDTVAARRQVAIVESQNQRAQPLRHL